MNQLTNLSTIRTLCGKYGFSFSKGLGQHFLVNAGICPKICDAADICREDTVLEIGPGFGALTRELAARAKAVIAIEVDFRLFPVLGETLAGLSNVRLVHADVLAADLAALIAQAQGGPVKVCANLPYNITSPVLMRLLEERLPFSSVTVMIQQEAARRITARPGLGGCGAVTYAVQYYAAARYLFTVNPGSFHPPPKVKSAVIALTPKFSLPYDGKPQRSARFFSLIRAGFNQRRKTLINALCASLEFSKQEVALALCGIGCPENCRCDMLTVEDYMRLEKALWPNSI